MKRWSQLWVALTRILELQKLSSPGSTQDSSQASSQNVLTSAFGTGDPIYLPQTPPRSSLLQDRPRLLPGVIPERFDLCVRDRRSHLPAPDSSKKLSSPGSTQDSSQASSQNVLTSAFGTGDPSYLLQTPPRSSLLQDRPRLLPGVIPERFDLCVRDRRSHLPAPDSSKKLSSPGSTQDSSQASSHNVLTSAFGTGDPIYLPQTPPRSSLLRDRPKTPRQAGEGSLAEALEKEEGLSFRLAGALGFHLSPVFLLFLLELLGYLSRKVKWLKVSWFQLG
ncbi:uncharacterized protein LOC126037102 isoform X3 [Accipiter gentilis]|uniref:uncharacterized protein LOC126037102 isoform X1 n=1 Tax=Astur gentilis TaxID=8957 RepID=UPI0021107ED2|nr:uncharacterized protein LOC126037102 isoform X1 [Accipiter gentilis]XP_049653273.1 uncharacterized protein LOC126037102 isoform X2 [Accipiter gentilis]XP_049653274.1 uncharacterized protein LOC126037102 isoform X3 [Accipiter gentilis]